MATKFYINADYQVIARWIMAKSQRWGYICDGDNDTALEYTLQRAREYFNGETRRIGVEYSLIVSDETGKEIMFSGTPTFAFVFDLLPVGKERTEVTAMIFLPVATEYYVELLQEMAEAWPECSADILAGLGIGAEPQESKKRGPTTKTQDRAEVFKKLKDHHPEWGYDTVATKAQEELGESVTGETVRNCYKAMNWKWERADRIR